jgi:hypothetical protein
MISTPRNGEKGRDRLAAKPADLIPEGRRLQLVEAEFRELKPLKALCSVVCGTCLTLTFTRYREYRWLSLQESMQLEYGKFCEKVWYYSKKYGLIFLRRGGFRVKS